MSSARVEWLRRDGLPLQHNFNAPWVIGFVGLFTFLRIVLNPFARFWQISFWLLMLLTLVFALVPVEYLPLSPSILAWEAAMHSFAFVCIGSIGTLAYRSWIAPLFVGLVAFGVLTELLQSAGGLRSGTWSDWYADLAGIVLGMLLGLAVQIFMRREGPVHIRSSK